MFIPPPPLFFALNQSIHHFSCSLMYVSVQLLPQRGLISSVTCKSRAFPKETIHNGLNFLPFLPAMSAQLKSGGLVFIETRYVSRKRESCTDSSQERGGGTRTRRTSGLDLDLGYGYGSIIPELLHRNRVKSPKLPRVYTSVMETKKFSRLRLNVNFLKCWSDPNLCVLGRLARLEE